MSNDSGGDTGTSCLEHNFFSDFEACPKCLVDVLTRSNNDLRRQLAEVTKDRDDALLIIGDLREMFAEEKEAREQAEVERDELQIALEQKSLYAQDHLAHHLGIAAKKIANKLEKAEAELSNRAVWERRFHGKPCYFCGEPVNSFSAFPGEWPILLSHDDEPGKPKPHHMKCIDARLDELSQWRERWEKASNITYQRFDGSYAKGRFVLLEDETP